MHPQSFADLCKLIADLGIEGRFDRLPIQFGQARSQFESLCGLCRLTFKVFNPACRTKRLCELITGLVIVWGESDSAAEVVDCIFMGRFVQLDSTEQGVCGCVIGISTERLRFLNTVGVALYRAEQIEDSMEQLNRSLTVQSLERQPFDSYFLSICHAHRGDQATAQRMFHESETLVRAHDAKLTAKIRSELTQFAEESRLLLIPVPLK